jgi:hypothetical protein
VDSDQIRNFSKGLFGNRYRLEIAAEIAQMDGDLFHAKELADNLGIAHNVVSGQLRSFVDVGVCDDMPSVSGQRHRFFRRNDSSYWSGCLATFEELATRLPHGQ